MNTVLLAIALAAASHQSVFANDHFTPSPNLSTARLVHLEGETTTARTDVYGTTIVECAFDPHGLTHDCRLVGGHTLDDVMALLQRRLAGCDALVSQEADIIKDLSASALRLDVSYKLAMAEDERYEDSLERQLGACRRSPANRTRP